MQNNLSFLTLFTFLFLISCNTPQRNSISQQNRSESQPSEVIWNLNVSSYSNILSENSSLDYSLNNQPTSTPQLISQIDFEESFSAALRKTENEILKKSGNETDNAQWLYFSPGENSTESMEKLYVAFMNSGEQIWTSDYSLKFYAGNNPSQDDTIAFSGTTKPGEQAVFEIPITTSAQNWKSCWWLVNPSGESIYDFCYSHGNGINTSNQQYSQNNQSFDQNNGAFFAFTKYEGSAPEKYSSSELSAEFVATSPENGHDFEAYDHYESLSVSFQNTGSRSWDSSFSLVFYAGYNWMHSNSFTLEGITNSGETATITIPMEIFEDNDRWYTCWYLSSPDGKNLSDFCFNYYTSS